MGCRVNQAESERLGQEGRSHGLRPAQVGEPPDWVIINTCSVTGESDRQARQAIRRAARENPRARIVVTGCYAQRDPRSLAALPGVEMVLGNGEKTAFWEYVRPAPRLTTDTAGLDPVRDHQNRQSPAAGSAIIRAGPVSAIDRLAGTTVVDDPSVRTRAFLQVQDGCDRHCTFCLIPGVRGAGRSLPPERVLEQAQRLQESGFKELVLTGINLGSYGHDLSPPTSLARLIDTLAAAPGAARLRLSSLDPRDLDENLFKSFEKQPRLCDHLHLSVQSGDDLILKRMGREYDRSLILKQAQRLKKIRPDLVLGADLIVGFPTEDETAFSATLDLVKRAELALLHVFRYSDRPGTPAAAIPARFRTAGDIIRQRSERLRQTGESVRNQVFERWIGRTVPVLVEEVNRGVAKGRSAAFLPVVFTPAKQPVPGDLLPVRLVRMDPEQGLLIGN